MDIKQERVMDEGMKQTYDKGRTAAAVKDTPRQRRKWINGKGLAFRAWQQFGETETTPEAVREWLNKTSREGMI